jgi:hypothetical protein
MLGFALAVEDDSITPGVSRPREAHMTDPTGKVAEPGDFGTGGSEASASAGTTEAPAHTSQDERPSRPSAADEEGGTAYKAPLLDRPLPSDEPLRVRLAEEE